MAFRAATHHATQEAPQTVTQTVVDTPPIETPKVEAPIVEAPKVETPKIEEPKVEPKVEFNPNQYLSEKTSGRIKEESELLTILDKVNAFDEQGKKLTEYEARLKEVEPANDFVAELNKLLKNGASREQVIEFYNLSQTDLNTLSPKDAEILRLQKEKGLSLEDAKFSVERKLNIDVLDEETVRANEIELKSRFKDNVSYLNQYRKELSVTEAQKKTEIETATKKQYLDKVNEIAPKLAQELKSVKIADIAVEKDNPIPFEYVLPDDFRKEADSILRNTIISNGYDVNNPSDMEMAKEVTLKIAIASDPERYARAVVKHYQAVIAETQAGKNAKSVTEQKAVIVNNGTPVMARPKVVFRQKNS